MDWVPDAQYVFCNMNDEWRSVGKMSLKDVREPARTNESIEETIIDSHYNLNHWINQNSSTWQTLYAVIGSVFITCSNYYLQAIWG